MHREKDTEKGIGVKDAVIAASRYFTDVTGYTSGVSVEEIEYNEKENYWLITLGFLDRPEMAYFEPKRSYKVFKVNANTGDVFSMKIRKI